MFLSSSRDLSTISLLKRDPSQEENDLFTGPFLNTAAYAPLAP